MAALLWRNFWHPPSKADPSIRKKDDIDLGIDFSYSYSYSFALEYKGPLPVCSSDIPRAAPIDIDQIPTASTAVDGWLVNNNAASLPIVYPIIHPKTKPNPVAEIASTAEDDVLLSVTSSDTIDGCGDDGSSRCSTSSNYCSQEGDEKSDDEAEPPCHVRKSSIVAFHDSGIQEFSVEIIEPDPVPVKPKIENKIPCHRCSKGNLFTHKESCIVCDARYCRNCVLKAMGGMPEGRKCLVCVGFRIDESKWNSLGKCSTMLKHIFGKSEIKRIMKCEVSCALNHLPPNAVYVNGDPLNEAALRMLQSCPNPPTKLRPGCYWYDKVSGFWGKVGHKPSQLISSQLKICGQIKQDASNGNTGILVNNREITKHEVMMLKWAGIQCKGKPDLWVTEDGSCSEAGQKDIRGKIWTKMTTRTLCKMVSLPTPPSTIKDCGEKAKNNPEQCLRKLLLLGYEKSGTSTIFKQAKLLHQVPFTEQESDNIKLVIQKNLFEYMGILLEACDKFAEEKTREDSLRAKGKGLMIDECGSSGWPREDRSNYSISPMLKGFSDWLLKVIESGNLEDIILSATRDYARFVEELWTDGAIQATYNRRNQIGKLPRVATYFLERATEISREDYVPSDMDILYAEGISKGLACTEFSLPKFAETEQCTDLKDRYQLIRVHPRSLEGSCKWLQMFETVDMVLFCVSLSDYDEVVFDDTGAPTNKMLETKKLFEKIVTDPSLNNKEFLLVLNKFDLLEEKIEQVPLDRCEWFQDFSPVISHNHNNAVSMNPIPSLGQRAFHYIAVKFKRLFSEITGRKLFVSVVTGLERDGVDECLRYAREIMNWEEEEEEEVTYINEESSASVDASSS